MVFTVKYTDERCKIDAINALNAIQGVSAENDQNKGKLLRDVTVTLTGSADHQIPGRILKIFGSAHKKLVFKVTFKDPTHQRNALTMVKALKGVVNAEFERVDRTATIYGPNTPLTLNVTGDADPGIVLNTIRTARLH